MNKNNKIIAEFMAHEEQDMSFRIPKHILKLEQENDCPNSKDVDCWDVPLKSLQYHESWDWLMPVITNCKNVDADWINENAQHLIDSIDDAITCCYGIEETFQAVVEFIKHYNQKIKDYGI